MAIVQELERGDTTRTLAAIDLMRLAMRWRAEAVRHERAADAIYDRDHDRPMTDEQMLHLEIARTLRNCARDLGA